MCSCGVKLAVTPNMPSSLGHVKWFNTTVGYGFVVADDGTEVFVHSNACERGFLANGERVMFDIEPAPRKAHKSRQAVRVVRICQSDQQAETKSDSESDCSTATYGPIVIQTTIEKIPVHATTCIC